MAFLVAVAFVFIALILLLCATCRGETVTNTDVIRFYAQEPTNAVATNQWPRTNCFYQLQSSPDLKAWTAITNFPANGAWVEFWHQTTNGALYYRTQSLELTN